GITEMSAMEVLLTILAIIIALPGAYITKAIYVDLPHKVGYFKFILMIILYITFVAFAVYLLTEHYLNLISFIALIYLIELPAVYYLRKEIIRALKRDFTMKGEAEYIAILKY